MTSKDKLRLGLAGGLLLVAGLLFALLSRTPDIPKGPETKTLWYCWACRSSFELTGSQTAEAIRERLVRPTKSGAKGQSAPRLPGRTNVEVVTCPFCKELAGVAARRCPSCGEVFAARTKDGAIAVCPNAECWWDPTTGRRAEGDRLGVGVP
jgi:hypothetical protein